MQFLDELQVRAELYKCNATDLDVAKAAWVSHTPDPREQESDRLPGLINFLYRNRHMSPFEHGSFTFHIQCPIFVAREFHRHRTMSYNETSGRYSELKPLFYIPSRARPLLQQGKVGSYVFANPDNDDEFERLYHITVGSFVKVYKTAWGEYQFMLGEGIAKEVARDVLPLGIMTSFFATCNPRNLMQFLDLRTDEQALFEIRQVAEDMEAALADQMPITYAAWKNIK